MLSDFQPGLSKVPVSSASLFITLDQLHHHRNHYKHHQEWAPFNRFCNFVQLWALCMYTCIHACMYTKFWDIEYKVLGTLHTKFWDKHFAYRALFLHQSRLGAPPLPSLLTTLSLSFSQEYERRKIVHTSLGATGQIYQATKSVKTPTGPHFITI